MSESKISNECEHDEGVIPMSIKGVSEMSISHSGHNNKIDYPLKYFWMMSSPNISLDEYYFERKSTTSFS